MLFQEKLKRLAADVNKAKVGRAVGLGDTTISTYMAKNSRPRADIALKMARAFSVDFEWLVDDSKEWPPPDDKPTTAADLTDQQLMHEMARRFRGALVDFLNDVDEAKSIDWKAAMREVEASPKMLPELARWAMHTLGSVQVKFSRFLQDFDLAFYCMKHHLVLPGADRKLADLEDAQLGITWQTVAAIPYINEFADAVSEHPEWLPLGLKFHTEFLDGKLRPYIVAVYAERQVAAQSDRPANPS